MKSMDRKIAALGTGLLWALLSGAPTFADDTDIFTGTASSAAPSNILLVLDGSDSMGSTLITQTNYDPSGTYSAGGCDPNKVYFTLDNDPPTCDTDRWLNRTSVQCQAALDAFADTSGGGGTYIDLFASYDGLGDTAYWEELPNPADDDDDDDDRSRPLECADDWSVHGGGSTPDTDVYPRNGNQNERWTSGTDQRIQWGSAPYDQQYRLYDGKWLAWYYSPGVLSTRLQVMKDVANTLVNNNDGVNIGVVQLNETDGGRVTAAVRDVLAPGVRDALHTAINGVTAAGFTPASETLYEATLYMLGRGVDLGVESVAESRLAADNGVYNSPITASCQKTHIVYVTDGEPTQDADADAKIRALTDAAGDSIGEMVDTIAGDQCDAETYPTVTPPWAPVGGACLDELAEFLHDGDLSPLAGQQNATVHTVGFALGGRDLPILRETAARGGGAYYEAGDTASLATALQEVVTNALESQATFTAPTVATSSFNRTRHLNDVFVSVFEPSSTEHWPGNLKKYRLRPSDGVIVDSTGAAAIDPATGLFVNTARSFWLDSGADPDGADAEAGGAAHRIPTDRKVYTYLGNAALTHPSNRVWESNDDITEGILNVADPDEREAVLAFINGVDAADHDDDGIPNEPRNQLGDPLHSEAASVTYGPDADDTIVYFATNDGFLHAVNSADGTEQWAFIPEEFLRNQVDLFDDLAAPTKNYGIDGNLRVQSIGNNDGVVEQSEGERVYLFFGMRRGGGEYYALDVTIPLQPTLLWHLDGEKLTGNGQSWSSATPARMNIAGVGQSASKLVVVLGGGYDPSQDDEDAVLDDVGNSIYIVDSESGEVLWHGTQSLADGVDAVFDTEKWAMQYSIPADVKVIDFDGDGFADRMYAADMGGQVWRFDVSNGAEPADLIAGGVIAQLGATESEAIEDVRRFYYSPDVAMVSRPNLTYLHIGIGSGHRARPLSMANEDRFYALRDTNGLRKMTQLEYNGPTPTTDSELDTITSENTPIEGQKGWKLELGAGEKVLAEARTFNDQVFFTTYTPSGGTAGPCQAPTLGTNRLYVMNVLNGAPVTNFDRSTDNEALEFADISTVIQGSIASQVVFLFPTAEVDPETGEPCTGNECNVQPVACVDLFCMPTGFGNNPVRTFWRQENVD